MTNQTRIAARLREVLALLDINGPDIPADDADLLDAMHYALTRVAEEIRYAQELARLQAMKATRAAAVAAPSALHAAIMNLESTPPAGYDINQTLGYKIGHRDARHAAAELALTQRAAPLVPCPVCGNEAAHAVEVLQHVYFIPKGLIKKEQQ